MLNKKAPIDIIMSIGAIISRYHPTLGSKLSQLRIMADIFNANTRFCLNKCDFLLSAKEFLGEFHKNICIGFHQPPTLYGKIRFAFSQSSFLINLVLNNYTPAGRITLLHCYTYMCFCQQTILKRHYVLYVIRSLLFIWPGKLM